MEEILLTWVRASRDRHFLLVIAGRLSGIHGWKRTHNPAAYQVIDSTVIIHFDGSEHLTISDVTDVIMRPGGELFVEDAGEVRFAWSSDRDPDKDCEEIFKKVGGAILFNRTDDLYTTSTVFGPLVGEFVVLR